MKHCYKTPEEPTAIATFRTEHPNANWDMFKDEGQIYKDTVEQLRKDQRGLCAFCEMELDQTNRQVAHFHPKSDRSDPVQNWALVWSNLWLCCKGGTQTSTRDPEKYLPPLPENRSCDEQKEDKILDGKILRPCDVPLFPRIFGYKQRSNVVEIVVDEQFCLDAGIDPIVAKQTIDDLHLNCTRLARARLEVLKLLNNDIKLAREAGSANLAATHLPEKWLAIQSSGHYRKFFTLIRWTLRNAAEQYLESVNFKG